MSKNKKRYSYVGVSFIVLIFGIWAIPKIANYFSSNTLVEIGPVPSFKAIDQNGKTVTNKSFLDKVYVIEFFFTSCPGICITMNKNMQQIQESFWDRADFSIASFTIDPERDTLEKLKAYAKSYKANSHWHFLRSEFPNVNDLASKGFGLYLGKSDRPETGGFEHSGMFVLIDKKGNIRCRKDANDNPIVYYDGLEQNSIQTLKEDIKLLLK